MHGVLLVDKAIGETSTDVVRIVKKAFNTKKVGHTGTLDPFATGLLPICLGEALKYSRWLLDARKTYEFTLMLGKRTDTADLTGQVIETADIPQALNLEPTLNHFLGEISQIPPKFSALRVNGKRAYELARAGEQVQLAPRQVTIHDLSLSQVNDHTLAGKATVSKGTYIRTLCEDIAAHLGSVGHCVQLRRTTVTPYELSARCISTGALLEWFEKTEKSELSNELLPVDSLCQAFPMATMTDEEIEKLRQGQKLNKKETSGIYRLYAKNGQFIGLVEQKNQQLKAFRLMRN